MNGTRTIATFLGVLLASATISAVRADSIPARPEFGVLDQASIFPLPVLKTTERMISEHERLTLERISILTLTGVSKGGLSEISGPVFDAWAASAPRPPSSVLILVSGDRGEIEVRTGLGLDPVLSSAKIADLRKRIFAPEWAARKPSRAVILSFVEVLTALDSPLISGNEVTDAYERAGFSGGWIPAAPTRRSWTPWFFAVLGILTAAFVLVRILIGEVHYTATGWFPIPASRNLRRLFRRRGRTSSLVTGGGVSGKY